MGHITNADVVGVIRRGGEVSGRNRNFWGHGENPGRYFSANRGYIPKGVARSLDEVAARNGGYQGVIYSYSTPIAVQISGVWFVPDVSYSATTSGRHQTHLYGPDMEWIPWDAGVEEIESVLAGDIKYDKHKETYRKGAGR